MNAATITTHLKGKTVAGSIPVKESTVTGPKSATPAKKATPRKAPAKTPGKAVAKVTKAVEKSDFTKAAATKLTERIKKGANATYEDIIKAYTGRIWLALDCKSWDEYLDKHYEGVPMSLPREKKKEAVASLAAAGVSSRAIAAATGMSQSTAARKAKEAAKGSGESSDSGDKPEVIDAEVVSVQDGDGLSEFKGGEPEEQRRLGADGKSYPASQPPREPVVINIVSAARTLSKELENVRIRMDSLFSREDYAENKVDVQGTLETAVGDMLDTVVEEFPDLVRERAPEGEPEPVA